MTQPQLRRQVSQSVPAPLRPIAHTDQVKSPATSQPIHAPCHGIGVVPCNTRRVRIPASHRLTSVVATDSPTGSTISPLLPPPRTHTLTPAPSCVTLDPATLPWHWNGSIDCPTRPHHRPSRADMCRCHSSIGAIYLNFHAHCRYRPPPLRHGTAQPPRIIASDCLTSVVQLLQGCASHN